MRARLLLSVAWVGLAFLIPAMAQAQTTDLVVTMTDTPDPVQPGGTITYTITLTN